MIKHRLLFILLLLTLLVVGQSAPKPNILIVLVDDAGYGDFSCHGHPFLKTPNIDRLHDESVRLTDFHVSPMCTPTRGQLMTGMDALRNAAASVTAGRAFMRPGIPTLPEMLAAAGYRTGIFGKWHLGDSYPHRPMDKDFQEAVWLKGWGFTSAPEFANTLFDGRCHRGTEETRFDGYITDFCFNEAMQWMRDRKARSEPFFCYLPLHAAHSPHVVAEKYSAPFNENAKGASGFFGMIANIDENMGRLESFLKQTRLRDDTIVIFMTDNGGTAGVRFYNAGLRGRKSEYYEGGHRVPCFVRWPAGGFRASDDIAIPTQIQDMAPTLLELAEVKPLATAKFDGASLASLLRGKTDTLSDRMLVVQFGASLTEPNDPTKGRSCVIWNQWRLVHGRELYDVQADRAQERNLATAHPEVLEKLRTYYERWWSGLEPTLNDFVTISIGAAAENPVELTSSDWQDIYADNSNHIRTGVGGPRGGFWNVLVEQEGAYEITLRRWPPELDLPLSAANGENSVAFPIATTRLTIAGKQVSAKAAAGASSVSVRVQLPKGRTQLQAWFQDATGKDLCGAYYANVELLNRP